MVIKKKLKVLLMSLVLYVKQSKYSFIESISKDTGS